jgi:hypothetical protein
VSGRAACGSDKLQAALFLDAHIRIGFRIQLPTAQGFAMFHFISRVTASLIIRHFLPFYLTAFA